MAPAAQNSTPPVDSVLPSRIWACIVCYRASANSLKPLVDVLEPQVERVLLLDNSPDYRSGLDTLSSTRIVVMPMPGNRGTGGAMNAAWDRAVAEGAGFLIAFDQDSAPGQTLVGDLFRAFEQSSSRGVKVAAAGPQKVDPRTGRRMRLLLPVRGLKHYAAADVTGPVAVDHVITSGCLIATAAFLDVGPYLASLFLDYVDIEWCLRARAKGYVLLAVPEVTMAHVIGDDVVRLGTRSAWVHTPERNRLLVRNHLWLWRVATMPRMWLLNDAVYLVVKLAVQCATAPPRLERLRQIWCGLRDGMRGVPPDSRAER